MKHIKKFESKESLEESLDIEYITNCFIELIDDGATKQYTDRTDSFTISINIPVLPETNEINIKEYIDNEKKRVLILEEIEYSLEKVFLKHKNVNYIISSSRFSGVRREVTNTIYINFKV